MLKCVVGPSRELRLTTGLPISIMSSSVTPFRLTSTHSLSLLRQALEISQKSGTKTGKSFSNTSPSYLQRYRDDESDGADTVGPESSDSYSDTENDDIIDDIQCEEISQKCSSTVTTQSSQLQHQSFTFTKENLKHFQSLSLVHFEFDTDTHDHISLPSSLFTKTQIQASSSDSYSLCQTAVKLAEDLLERCTIVISVRSGRFAGAVFGPDGNCLVHRTSVRYTVRKGQGKAQSAQDGQRRPKSAGSQLRRAGEEQLRQDIRETAMQWSRYFREAGLALVSCPKTMKKTLYDCLEGIISKEDPRIRSVPLDTGRPTYESVQLINGVMLTASTTIIAPTESEDIMLDNFPDAELPRKDDESSHAWVAPMDVPLTPLHLAARDGDLASITEIIQSNAMGINIRGGVDCMTALHFAASSNVAPELAAQCLYTLLVDGSADPCVLDARDRPPYFVSNHDKIREAFRRARAFLGEDFCDWDRAKVGPALSEEEILIKRAREAEKRRQKRLRQKEKKEKEKSMAEDAERSKQEAQALARAEEDAERVRCGLQPKLPNRDGTVCDFCQKLVVGRRKFQMFKRLEYSYCSSECVQAHKRELVAKAAMSRLGCS